MDMPADLSQLPRDPFTELVGLEWDELSATVVLAHLEVTEQHHQPTGIVHGGVYATIIEVTASMGATMRLTEPGTVAVGISNYTDFIRAHRTGRLDVRAEPVASDPPRRQVWTVEVTRAVDGKLVAKGTVNLAVISAG